MFIIFCGERFSGFNCVQAYVVAMEDFSRHVKAEIATDY